MRVDPGGHRGNRCGDRRNGRAHQVGRGNADPDRREQLFRRHAIRGGTLQIGAGGTSGSIGGDVENDGRLVFNRSDSVTFAGAISGLGAVDQSGNGILTLTGANSYSGGTNVRAGTLQIARDANIGAATGALLVDSATLRWTAAFDLAATRPITLGAGGATFDTNGFGSTISQGIGGPGGLDQDRRRPARARGQQRLCRADVDRRGRARGHRLDPFGHHGRAERHLERHRQIFGDVLNRGLIAPGNSIGTLTIAGNYSGEGGTLEIETDPRQRRLAERPARHRRRSRDRLDDRAGPQSRRRGRPDHRRRHPRGRCRRRRDHRARRVHACRAGLRRAL